MAERVRIMLALVLAVAVGATACGSSSTTGADESVDASTTQTTATDQRAIITEWAVSAADDLVVRLGTDDAALDALFLSLNRGYSTAQVKEALTNTGLQGDGSITDVQEAHTPLNMILLPRQDDEGEGEGAFSVESAPDNLAFAQMPLLPIQQLRELARKNARVVRASGREIGNEGVSFIVTLIDAGFAPADVIELTILGIDAAVTSSGILGTGAGQFGIELPANCSLAFLVVDEFICNNGSRVMVGAQEQDERAQTDEPDQSAATDTDSTTVNVGLDANYGGRFTVEAGRSETVIENSVVLWVEDEMIAGFDATLHFVLAAEDNLRADGGNTHTCGAEGRFLYTGLPETVRVTDGLIIMDLAGTYDFTQTADDVCDAENELFDVPTQVSIVIDGDSASFTIEANDALTGVLTRE